jgi:hypothetical protein
MATKDSSPQERIQSSFKRLSASAPDLNSASDGLNNAVAGLEQALQKLNLGISAWITISSGDNPDNGYHWSRELGYSKVAKKWGIALRATTGLDCTDTEDDSEEWPFAEAPRWMRVEAVGKIPDLIEHLVSQVETTTKHLRKKTVEVTTLVTAIQEPAPEKSSQRHEAQS